MPRSSPFRPAAVAGLLALALSAPALRAQPGPPASTPGAGEQALSQRVERLAEELARLRAELDAMRSQAAARASSPAPAQDAPAVPAAGPSAPAPAAAEAAPPREPATVLGSYGEINYNRPRNDAAGARADLRRMVLGFQHRFDERTRVVTEIEIEHAVSSADDAGEVAIEQAYVERQFTPRWAARAGLFLVPMGLLNENHEPTAYYGVERNFVETAIIPSTWREGGVQFIGELGRGLTLQAGVATGFDLGAWDAGSTEGRESPLGSIHQELAQARARDLSVFASANWRGRPGLLLGSGVFTGGASQGTLAQSARVTLWDAHARWTPGPWDLSALYARGTISGAAALNTTLVGNPTLVPSLFDGGYLQAAYRLWHRGEQSVSPFVRWERFNTAAAYDGLGAGLTPAAADDERVWTLGANWRVGTGVVLKADYQRFARDRSADRFNLGVGWSF